MIFTSVYRAAPQWAQQALIELRKAGLTAEILDDPTPNVRHRSAVRVGVPEGQQPEAREVLRRWAEESEKAAGLLGRGVGSALATVFLPPLVVWMAPEVGLTPGLPTWLRWACLFWILGAGAVVALLQRRNLRAES